MSRRRVADLGLVAVRPDQHLEGQVEGGRRRRRHHRCPGQWAAEDDDLGVAQLEPDGLAPPRCGRSRRRPSSRAPRPSVTSRDTVSGTDRGLSLVTTPAPSWATVGGERAGFGTVLGHSVLLDRLCRRPRAAAPAVEDSRLSPADRIGTPPRSSPTGRREPGWRRPRSARAARTGMECVMGTGSRRCIGPHPRVGPDTPDHRSDDGSTSHGKLSTATGVSGLATVDEPPVLSMTLVMPP